ncbi:Phytoene synthase [Candidatus Portiera aleyrodidarum]|uniref:Phytoene synthase n=1 Tax=Candidatus Portiera aleyrodidarum TaxID=91844 RepID=A0A6S6RZT7_9GAMM|nr:squalene/phytoene synthase family protein [Candidatus Portiera aleyrodidarum]CAA3707360.1 Phytoene synthase [Candidatus Portiera aleyrodidarum]
MKQNFYKKSNKIVNIYSKNLYFTSFFIKKQYSKYIKLLYFICRTLDEIADKNNLASKKTKSFKRLNLILNQLKNKYNKNLDKLSFLIQILKKNTAINIKFFIALIKMLIKDIHYPANIKTEKELIYYCYGVAGTIGLLIFPIIKSSRHNIRNAIHLGIFMQLINIARDVLEDALKGRRYLPARWVNNISAKEIIYLSNSPINKKHKIINNAILNTLNLSHYFYYKGINNIYQLNYTNRIFIKIISSIYYKIHNQIRKTNRHNIHNWIYKRIFITLYYKIFLILKIVLICYKMT